MSNFFNISDTDMLNPYKVKLISGIAGSAKSSNIDRFFKEKNIPYARFTSTNKLRRDALSRYGGICKTIAGGLFQTIQGAFFADEKDLFIKHVVIDEILQTDTRVFKWIANHRQLTNIIVTTDERQMLSKEQQKFMLNRFYALRDADYSVYRELKKTYRARDAKTERYYNICYDSVIDDAVNRFKTDAKFFKHIPFAELQYNHDDVFICHSNLLELKLFKEWDIYHDYSAELIPKGSIASKDVFDAERYPIVPQAQVSNNLYAYLQPSNVGSVTRYQGSEVNNRQTLYFLVCENDFVSNREWYTAITRAWTIDNIVIVDCKDTDDVKPLTEWNGKPIKRNSFFIISGRDKLSDGTSLAEIVNNTQGREILLDDKDFNLLLQKVQDNDTKHYTRNALVIQDKIIKRKPSEDYEAPPRNAPTMFGLLAKEPEFNYDYMPEFYRALEKVQKNRFPGAKCVIDWLQPASIISQERGAETPFPLKEAYEYTRPRNSYQYGLDFYSSYPSILYNEKLPTGSYFCARSDDIKDNEFHTSIQTDGIDWYISFCDLLAEGSICTGDLVRFIQENLGVWAEFHYIGSSSAKQSSDMGKRLYDMAFKTKESKALIKHVHYGLADRPYLERIDFDEKGECKAYCLNERQNHQLLMCAIRSYQCLNNLKAAKIIYGDLKHGTTNADCFYFDTDRRFSKLGEELKETLPGYDFRIFTNNKKRERVVFKTYEALPTAEEYKKKKKSLDKKTKK